MIHKLQDPCYMSRNDDFVEIDLKGLDLPRVGYSRDSSVSEDTRLSILSSLGGSPSLVTDASSLRSSLSSVSSPALNGSYSFGHKPSALVTNITSSYTEGMENDSRGHIYSNGSSSSLNKMDAAPYKCKNSTVPTFNNLPRHQLSDNSLTSTASLSQYPSFKTRHRKQRESQYDAAENDNDFVPSDLMMFNVPMTPALYAQEKLTRSTKQSSQSTSPAGPKEVNTGEQHRGKTGDGTRQRFRPCLPQLSTHTERRQSRGHVSPRSSLPSINEGEVQEQSVSDRKESVRNTPPISPRFSNQFAGFKPREIENWEDDARRIAEALAKRPSTTTSAKSLKSQPKKSVDLSHQTNVLPSPNSSESDISDCAPHCSLTRPSFLPHKSTAEEQSHLKEFTRLMEHAAEQEQSRKSAEIKQNQLRHTQEQIDANLWAVWLESPKKQHVVRDIIEKKIWWRGLPERVRSKVWLRQARIAPSGGAELPRVATSLVDPALQVAIDADTEVVWPQLGIFGQGRPLHDALVNVVTNFITRSPRLQYDTAISRVAALLLLNADEYDAFNLLVYIFKGSLPGAILMGNDQSRIAYYDVYQQVFSQRFVQLSQHFYNVKIAPKHYLDSMLKSLFCEQVTPEAAARIIDVYLFEGDNFLLRAALGIIRTHEYALYQERDAILKELVKPITVDEQILMHTIREITRE